MPPAAFLVRARKPRQSGAFHVSGGAVGRGGTELTVSATDTVSPRDLSSEATSATISRSEGGGNSDVGGADVIVCAAEAEEMEWVCLETGCGLGQNGGRRLVRRAARSGAQRGRGGIDSCRASLLVAGRTGDDGSAGKEGRWQRGREGPLGWLWLACGRGRGTEIHGSDGVLGLLVDLDGRFNHLLMPRRCEYGARKVCEASIR